MDPVITKVYEADNHYHFMCKSSTTKNDSEDMDTLETRFKLKKIDTWLDRQNEVTKEEKQKDLRGVLDLLKIDSSNEEELNESSVM
jgi:hypothetical protein